MYWIAQLQTVILIYYFTAGYLKKTVTVQRTFVAIAFVQKWKNGFLTLHPPQHAQSVPSSAPSFFTDSAESGPESESSASTRFWMTAIFSSAKISSIPASLSSRCGKNITLADCCVHGIKNRPCRMDSPPPLQNRFYILIISFLSRLFYRIFFITSFLSRLFLHRFIYIFYCIFRESAAGNCILLSCPHVWSERSCAHSPGRP